jgi:hypothetical protein
VFAILITDGLVPTTDNDIRVYSVHQSVGVSVKLTNLVAFVNQGPSPNPPWLVRTLRTFKLPDRFVGIQTYKKFPERSRGFEESPMPIVETVKTAVD